MLAYLDNGYLEHKTTQSQWKWTLKYFKTHCIWAKSPRSWCLTIIETTAKQSDWLVWSVLSYLEPLLLEFRTPPLGTYNPSLCFHYSTDTLTSLSSVWCSQLSESITLIHCNKQNSTFVWQLVLKSSRVDCKNVKI